MAEKSRQEQIAVMREAAARKRAKAKEELEAALQGKSREEQRIYKSKLRQEALKKRIAKLEKAHKKFIRAETQRKNRIFIALGAAVIIHHKAMEKPDEVLRQLQIVADSLAETSKKERKFKADVNEGIAIIIKERRMAQTETLAESAEISALQAEAQDGKEAGLGDLNAPSDEKDEPMALGAKPASPSKKKTALNKNAGEICATKERS